MPEYYDVNTIKLYCKGRGWDIPSGMSLPPLCVGTTSERKGTVNRRIYIYSEIAKRAGLPTLGQRFFVSYTNPSYGVWRVLPCPRNVTAIPSGLYSIYVRCAGNMLSLLIHETLDYFGGFPEYPGEARLCRGEFLEGGGLEISLVPEEYEDAAR